MEKEFIATKANSTMVNGGKIKNMAKELSSSTIKLNTKAFSKTTILRKDSSNILTEINTLEI